MPLLPWQRPLRGQIDIAHGPPSLIQMGRGCQTSPWRLPPFPLVGEGTAWNVLLIKTERSNRKISLSTARNISHSPSILWGAQSLWKGSILKGVLRLTRGENAVVKQVLGVVESPRERYLLQNQPLSLVSNMLSIKE